MSGLKYINGGAIDSAAYIRFVNHIMDEENYIDFGEERGKVIAVLRDKATAPKKTNFVRPDNNIPPAAVPVTKANTRIDVSYDNDIVDPKGRRRTNINLPEKVPENLEYLDDYVRKVCELSNAPIPGGQDLANARKFLFGVMLLTRCM